MECIKLSLERVIEKLEIMGLSKGDAMLYIYLAKNGPKNIRDLTDELNVRKQGLYDRLKKLQKKKLIITNKEIQSVFYAVSFEKVLDLLISTRTEQSEAIMETKNDLLSSWRSVDWKNNNHD